MNEYRDALAYLCHEIGNPLNSLLFKVYLIERSDSELLKGTSVKELASSALFDVNRMSRVIEDAKHFYNFKNKGVIEKEQFSLSDVISELIRHGSNRDEDSSLQISFTKTTDGIINADKIRIIQAISNILDNAIKFAPKGSNVIINLSDKKDYYELRIKDFGPGIDKNDIDLIFEPYIQLNKRAKEGLGLGLYLSKKFIECHDGKLSVESQKGSGSEFIIMLPKSRVTSSGDEEDRISFCQNSDKSGSLHH